MNKIKKLALITGGTKGLGKCLAFELAKQNYDIWAIFKNDIDAARACKKEFNDKGMFFEFIKFNIDGDKALDIKFLEDYNKIILIHNACDRFSPSKFHNIDLIDYRKQMETTFFSTVKLMQTLIKPLNKNKSDIVFILSQTLKKNVKGMSHYIAAKKALESLSESLALEYNNIKFHRFYPNFMPTSFSEYWDDHFINFYATEQEDPKDNAKNYVESILNISGGQIDD